MTYGLKEFRNNCRQDGLISAILQDIKETGNRYRSVRNESTAQPDPLERFAWAEYSDIEYRLYDIN